MQKTQSFKNQEAIQRRQCCEGKTNVDELIYFYFEESDGWNGMQVKQNKLINQRKTIGNDV